MLTRRPRAAMTSIPAPAIRSNSPNVSQPLPAPVDGVEVAPSTSPVGVGVAPPTPPAGVGVGVVPPTLAVGEGVGVGTVSQPRTRMNPEASVARSLPADLKGAHTSNW